MYEALSMLFQCCEITVDIGFHYHRCGLLDYVHIHVYMYMLRQLVMKGEKIPPLDPMLKTNLLVMLSLTLA